MNNPRGQAGKLFGSSVVAKCIRPLLFDIIGKLGETHLPTFGIAAVALPVAPRFSSTHPASRGEHEKRAKTPGRRCAGS
jgi:hypothetical protein